MTRWPVAARLALVAVIVAVAAVVALWPRSADSPGAGREAPAAAASPEERAAAGLIPCPRPPGAPARPDGAGTAAAPSSNAGPAESVPAGTGAAGDAGPLAGLNLTCLADGNPVDLRAALAGKPALLNLWAYWCAPCAKELPHLQEFAGRAGDRMTVLTVHSDPEEAFALSRLTGLGVTLPGVLDPGAALRNAVGAPAVLPISVLLRADGTVADVVVRSFTDTDDVARTVAGELGVLV
ncbi:TlpA family protein disulfide reductase [Nocardia asteroides]|uniref:TlpA family protein disulfide reductase n=1 Tax=Nocardia asteroides TaxID=1824 RepID=UPI001E2B79EF|nr:TlpA disulfide reductase family protein [Nocardia asteroides]UGT59532.1 TlpA family protein disulfide reductase [Nocardia asteroides]